MFAYKNQKLEFMIIVWFCFFSYWSAFHILRYSAILNMCVVAAIPFLLLIQSGHIKVNTPIILWILYIVIFTIQIFQGGAKVTTGIAWTIQKFLICIVMLWLFNYFTDYSGFTKIIFVCSFVFVLATVIEYLLPEMIHTISSVLLSSDQYFTVSELYTYGYHSGIAVQAGYNACLMAPALLLCLSYLFAVKEKTKKFFWIIGMSTSFIAIILTEKRGMLAAAIAAASFAFLLTLVYQKHDKTKKILIFIALVLLGIFIFIKTDIASNIVRRMQYKNNFLAGREGIWSVMIAGIIKHPIIGHGSVSLSTISKMTGHNAFLQIWYENGLIGLIPYATILALFLLYAIKIYRKINLNDSCNFIALFSAAFQVFFILSSLTDSLLLHNTTMILYIVIVFLPYAINRAGGQK